MGVVTTQHKMRSRFMDALVTEVFKLIVAVTGGGAVLPSVQFCLTNICSVKKMFVAVVLAHISSVTS
jgi:hypothetical protein